MSWITICLILSIFILIIIISQIFYDKAPCCETGWREVLSTIGIAGLIFSILIFIIYTLNSERTIYVEKIIPTYLSKSKTQVYLEFDKDDLHFNYSFSDAKNYNSINDSTIFYFVESINHWGLHDTKIKKQKLLPGIKKEDLDKWIKNRW